MGGFVPTPEQMTFDGSMNGLAAKVRAVHPGAYDDLNDADLTKKVLAKYPQYSDLAAPGIAPPKTLGTQIKEDEGKASTAGLPGGSPNIQPATDTMAKIAGGTIGAAGLAANAPAIGAGLLGAAKAAPTMAAMEAINYARSHLPGGKFIPAGAELLPMFMGGRGKTSGSRGIGEADATRMNEPYAGEEIPEPEPVFPKSRLGPEAPPPEVGKARGLGGYETPEPPAAGLGKIPPPTQPAEAPYQRTLPRGQYEAPASPIPPQKALGEGVIEGEYMNMDEPPPPPPTIRGSLSRGQYAAPPSSLPPPKQIGAGGPIPHSDFPPPEPTPRVSIPSPTAKTSPRAELLEDQGVQQDMRDYLDRQGKEVYKREPLGKSKQDMAADFKEGIGKNKIPPSSGVKEAPAQPFQAQIEDAKAHGYDVKLIDKTPKGFTAKHFPGTNTIEVYTRGRTPEQISSSLDHEIGHAVDYRRRGIVADPMGDSIRSASGEMQPMNDAQTYFRMGPQVEEAQAIRQEIPRKDGAANTQKEIYADAYRLYKSNPERLKEIAPTINKEITDFIGQKQPKPSLASRKSPAASPKDADLTPEWQAELDRVKAQKAKKGGR